MHVVRGTVVTQIVYLRRWWCTAGKMWLLIFWCCCFCCILLLYFCFLAFSLKLRSHFKSYTARASRLLIIEQNGLSKEGWVYSSFLIIAQLISQFRNYLNAMQNNFELCLSLLVFYVTRNDISVIYVTAQMCRRTEEVVPTVGLPTS